MKKILLTLLFVVATSFSLQAQTKLGGGIAYGFDVSELGIQLRGVHQFNDTWGGGADFVYYLDGVKDFSIWEFNVNAHYFLTSTDQAKLYALAGLNLFGASFTFLGETISNTEPGLNVGAGGQVGISDKISGIAELKFSIGDASQLLFGAGILVDLN
ncbi:MAG: hypothetical protein R3E32_12650 [Chitinophagales bacterium]